MALLRDDAIFTVPPSPSWYRGREAIGIVLTKQAFAAEAQNHWYFYPTQANGCPAFAVYRAIGSDSRARAFGIQVLTLEASASGVLIADVATFLEPSLLSVFSFPPEIAR